MLGIPITTIFNLVQELKVVEKTLGFHIDSRVFISIGKGGDRGGALDAGVGRGLAFFEGQEICGFATGNTT